MNQVMVMPAEQHEVIQIGLASVCPVFYMVPIYEFVIRAARESAAFVAHA